MRYQTKLLITAGLLLAMSLSAAALAYWGVAQSHMYLTRSRLSHEELERQLQLSRHSQQLFKSWTDTLLTGMTDKPLGAAYLHKVIQSDLATLHDLTVKELAIVGPDELKAESAELDRLEQIKKEFQHTLDQLAEVEQLRSRGRPDIAWQNLITLLKGGIDQKLNELIEVAVADETAEVIRIDADAAQLLSRLERISQIHAALAILTTLALVILLLARRWLWALLLLLATGVAELFMAVLKLLVARPRPPLEDARIVEAGFSFPSGHATAAATFYGTLAYLLIRCMSPDWLKALIGVTAALIVLAVGVSRIYLGVHYPTDVIGGWIIGFVWASICWLVAQRFEVRTGISAEKSKSA
jgi:membrane-associated phospholipid phosphatase